VSDPGVLFCASFAFAAAVQPGPLQAFLSSRAAADGWKRTLPASLAPLLSDILPALLALFAFGRLPVSAQPLLRTAGGLLLLYLAWSAARRLQPAVAPLATNPGSVPATLLQAALVSVLNPNPYLGWALVLGPAVAAAWHRHPASAVAMLLAFYGTMVATLAALIWVFGTARLLSVRAQRALIGASALILAALGIYQVGLGLAGLGAS
jgi:threonine/homoserine/homoserine lactone efflux protein